MRRLYYFSWRDECPFALVLAFLLSAVYWLTLPPGVTFEDTGLFATVCYNAGIAHPPGYPLHTLLCIPFARLADFFTAQSGTSNGAFIIDGRRCRRRFVL